LVKYTYVHNISCETVTTIKSTQSQKLQSITKHNMTFDRDINKIERYSSHSKANKTFYNKHTLNISHFAISIKHTGRLSKCYYNIAPLRVLYTV